MTEKIGIPTVSGLKNSLIDYAVGMGGGLIFAMSQAVTGSGLIGGLIGAGIAGSVVKGNRGTAIATVLGFQSIVGSIGQSSSNSDTDGVM